MYCSSFVKFAVMQLHVIDVTRWQGILFVPDHSDQTIAGLRVIHDSFENF